MQRRVDELTQRVAARTGCAGVRPPAPGKPAVFCREARTPGCVSWEQMRVYIRWSNAARFARMGDCCVEQIRGTQMGSTLSGIKASLDFCESEAAFIEGGYQTAGFEAPGFTLDEGIAVIRYVDDALLVSSTLCASCLEQVGATLYERPIVFEVEEVGQRVGFLDLMIEVVGGGLGGGLGALKIWRRNHNLDFMMGYARKPVKVRFGPPVGPGGPTRADLQAWVAQAWAADEQRTAQTFVRCADTRLGPEAAAWEALHGTAGRFAVAAGTPLELVALGHAPAAVRRAVSGVRAPQHRPFRRACMAMLQNLRRTAERMATTSTRRRRDGMSAGRGAGLPQSIVHEAVIAVHTAGGLH